MKLRLFASRLSWPVICLVLLLQRSPLVRYLSQLEHSLIPRVQHMWKVVVGAVTVGAYNTVTGASGDVIFDSRFDNDLTVTVGEEVEIVIDIDGGNHTPGSWEVVGEIPGVDWNVAGGTGAFRGNATQVGSFPMIVRAWRGDNMSGAQGDDLHFTVQVASLISQQPQAQTVDFGASAEFSVGIGGSQSVSYQWQKQNAETPEQYDDLDGQTAPTLNLATVGLEDAGNYRVVVTAGEIVVISDEVLLTVNPLITQHPTNQVGDWGGAAELSVQLAVLEGATYQWQKRNPDDPEQFDDLAGQTGSVLNFPVLFSDDAGDYRVVATVGSSMQVSDVATVSVNATALQVWKDMFFDDPFSEDTALDRDPDQDELINAVEFTFGLDPNSMQKEALVRTSQETIEGVVHAVYTFPPVTAGSESMVTVEGNATPGATGWAALTGGVDGVIIESTAEAYVVKLPAGTRQFNRLRIVAN